MDGFEPVRKLARRIHNEASLKAGGGKSADALLQAVSELTDIHRQPVPDDDPVLCGAEAVFEPSTPAIYYKDSVSPEQAAFYQAHEFGHHYLDSAASACNASDIDEHMLEERAPLGVQRVEGYGPHERRECQANVFAREFLLPRNEAERLFVDKRKSAADIAATIGAPIGLVHQQLAMALLTPPPLERPAPPRKSHPLDKNQLVAAEATGAPYLIEAGPGTGKTKTLIARIEWLLRKPVPPADILALTFSNKAAEEMRERIASTAPDAASAIWIGTFHAFGLEILRKYGEPLGLSAEVRLIDPGDALLMLEQNLPSLPLNHYLQLYEPAIALRDILNAISRAKDELISPQRYRVFGEAMLQAAGEDEDKREAAEKAVEVAEIYAAYETMLRDAGMVDFSDLINKPIELMNSHPETAAALKGQYQHILVDEYQDVNRASSVFLKLLAGDGAKLWVVGDARQSIYRFRGASPGNIRNFPNDFPGAQRLPLKKNYRSQEPVVRLFEAFAEIMKASDGGLPAKWSVHRGQSDGVVLMEIAENLDAEAVAVATEIAKRRATGTEYRDQAVLCRSHTNLARFAMRLEALGIPVLYFGDLFERPEIRDLLSLISFVCEPKRGGLLRLAQFPEYDIPLNDVRLFFSFAESHDIAPLEALRQIDALDALSPKGRTGLERLADHLKTVTIGMTPGALLFNYVFTHSRFLDPFLADDTVVGQQRRLAIFQLLNFACEEKLLGGNPCQQLLRWIRRLETFGEERQLRQLPAAASSIDAVRLLTIHASKGLEFSVVYLPGLGTTMLPVSPQYNPCPPPFGMLPESPADTHLEEEECLFFVAMSRARDGLVLSRAERYSSARKASSFLIKMAPHLPRSPESPATHRAADRILAHEDGYTSLGLNIEAHRAEDLDQYKRCPRAYLYQRILELSGARDDNAYVRFHRAVYAVLRWMSRIEPQKEVGIAEAMARLDAAWDEIGPAAHPLQSVYRETANRIVERAIARRSASGELIDAEWELKRPGGRIKVRPDHVETGAGGPVVRRLRTGRPPKSKIDDDIYALYHEAATRELSGAQVEALFLTTDEARPVPMTPTVINNRLKKYDEAIAGICAGLFPPIPNERECPRCPQYFICPALPTGLDET